MLKVDSIEFIDASGRTYTILNHQIEQFPLIGGGDATMIQTKVWNQHGNTPVEAYMDSFQGDLIFAIFTYHKNENEIAELRRDVSNICNPLNGNVTMKVKLNTGEIFNRDVTFTTAPIFPIGIENRNPDWFKVQLQYEANNPFWYAEDVLVETFQSVEPLFDFPFSMSTAAPVQFGRFLPANVATNDGQVGAPVVIRITGACTNPRIENQTTGEFLQFNNLVMDADDVLEIDTGFGQKKILLNGDNAFNKLDYTSTFFNLVTGDNVIEFTDETGSNEATIHFFYKNLYITI